MKRYLTLLVIFLSSCNDQNDLKNDIFDTFPIWVLCVLSFLGGSLLTLIIKDVTKGKSNHTKIRRPVDLTTEMHNNSKRIQNLIKGPNLAAKKTDENNIVESKSALYQDEKSPTIELEIVPKTNQLYVNQVSNAAEILYFPNPNIDGNFRKIDGKSAFIEGASIYVFTLMPNNEAALEFCSERSSVSMALNNRTELISQLATELNPYNQFASKIETVEKGTVLLEGTLWKVVKKATIKYI